MAIVRADIVGSPQQERAGYWRVEVEIEYDDGLIEIKTFDTPSLSDLQTQKDNFAEMMRQDRVTLDTAEAIKVAAEIGSVGQATNKEVALAYLRKAYRTGDPLTAYRLLNRFNNFRIAQGWTINQVVTQLSTVGLKQQEWDLLTARYAYLSDAGRVATMTAYDAVIAGDTWGERYR